MIEPAADDPARPRLQRELLEALSRTSLADDPTPLHRQLSDLLGPHPGPEPAAPGRYLQTVVAHGTASDDTVRRLVEMVAGIEGETTVVRLLRQLADDWYACHLLTEPARDLLRPLLRAVTLRTAGRYLRRAVEHIGSISLPAWCDHGWHVFVHLASRNAGEHGLPACMPFLELAAQEAPPADALVMRDWARERCRDLDLTSVHEQQRWLLDGDHGQPATSAAYLVIILDYDDVPSFEADDPVMVELKSWHHWRVGDQRHGEPFETVGLVEHELQAQLELTVRRGEASQPGQADTPMAVELVLPVDMLHIEAEWWDKRARVGRSTPLVLDHPVVLRSLDRCHNPGLHPQWRRRWRQLQDWPAHSRIHHSSPTGRDDFTRLLAEINDDQQVVGLVLSEPPPASRDEIDAALRGGLPVIIWHRKDCDLPAFRDLVSELATDRGLRDLPAATHKLRLAALKRDPADREDHIGRQIVLLWDDADRHPMMYSSGNPGSGGTR